MPSKNWAARTAASASTTFLRQCEIYFCYIKSLYVNMHHFTFSDYEWDYHSINIDIKIFVLHGSIIGNVNLKKTIEFINNILILSFELEKKQRTFIIFIRLV